MNLMKLWSLAIVAATVSLPLVGAQEQAPAAPEPVTPAPVTTAGVEVPRIAVMNIDRIALESDSGKKMIEMLNVEKQRIDTEQTRRQQEIQSLATKQGAEILSAEARARLQKDIERKQREGQRWLEDQQQDFQEKQQTEEAKFQELLAPIVEKVAKENGIGLIIRETPGLTYLLDPSFDITALVVNALNEAEAPGGAGEANP